jgi:hypothetical protein
MLAGLLLVSLPCSGCGKESGAPAQPGNQPGNQPEQAPHRPKGADPVNPRTSYASQLEVAAIPEGSMYESPKVSAASAPAQFELVLTKQMPMPGYRVEVESVQVLPADSLTDPAPKSAAGEWAIVVKLHEVAPEGFGLTVLDPKQIRLPIGALRVGAYRLHLMLRQGEAKVHEPVQQIGLVAK